MYLKKEIYIVLRTCLLSGLLMCILFCLIENVALSSDY